MENSTRNAYSRFIEEVEMKVGQWSFTKVITVGRQFPWLQSNKFNHESTNYDKKIIYMLPNLIFSVIFLRTRKWAFKWIFMCSRKLLRSKNLVTVSLWFTKTEALQTVWVQTGNTSFRKKNVLLIKNICQSFFWGITIHLHFRKGQKLYNNNLSFFQTFCNDLLYFHEFFFSVKTWLSQYTEK